MFTKEKLGLAERKRLIVLESDLHRGVLGLESESLRARFGSVREEVQTGNKWLLTASALAGLLVVRRGRGLSRFMPLALAAWQWFRHRRRRRE